MPAVHGMGNARSPLRGAAHQPVAVAAAGDQADRARRFRDAALPHLDDVYTVARYMLRSAADADDAVQECYLRALRHFDGFRGEAIKPWLLAILRNVCHAEYARRSGLLTVGAQADVAEDASPLWQEETHTAETEMARRQDAERLRGLVAALPDPFREAIVLRDIDDLSYRDIASVTGVPVGTVMSRIARGRSMLREAWLKSEHDEHCGEPHDETVTHEESCK
jgi:RNA polymerase sigma-70 factor, ECF subfamily